MKRPGVSEKMSIFPEHEPDLYRITELHPLAEEASADDGMLLESTFQKVRPGWAASTLNSCHNKSLPNIPRPVTPLSKTSPPNLPPMPLSLDQPAYVTSASKSSQATQKYATHLQGLEDQRSQLLSLIANNYDSAVFAQAVPSPNVSSLLQRFYAETVAPPVLHRLFSGAEHVPVWNNPLQGMSRSWGACPAPAAAVNSRAIGRLGLIEQALLAASCGQPGFLYR